MLARSKLILPISTREAGPEAIIPLHRSARALGLHAATGKALGAQAGGRHMTVNAPITVNITAPDGSMIESIKRAVKESSSELIRRLRAAEREDFRMAIV